MNEAENNILNIFLLQSGGARKKEGVLRDQHHLRVDPEHREAAETKSEEELRHRKRAAAAAQEPGGQRRGQEVLVPRLQPGIHAKVQSQGEYMQYDSCGATWKF